MFARRAGDRGREFRRARGRQFIAQQREDATAFGQRRNLVALFRAGDDEHEFAALLVAVRDDTRMDLAERRRDRRLEALGQLARERRATRVAEHRAEIGERIDDAMARFVENQRARFRDQRLQALAPRRRFRRQESFENETVAGDAGHRQRRDRRAWAGHRRDLATGFARRAHETETRIADQRRARVGDERDVVAFKQPRDDALRLLTLVVFVQRDQRRAAAALRDERRAVTRVLGGDERDTRERFARALREIAEVADRRRHDPQATLAFVHVHARAPGCRPRSAIIAAMTPRARMDPDMTACQRTNPLRTHPVRHMARVAHDGLRRALPIVFAVTLAACVPMQDDNLRPDAAQQSDAAQAEQLYAQGRLDDAARAFEQLADSEHGSRADHHRLRAAEALRDNGNLDGAASALQDVRRRRLHGEDALRVDLLDAEIALHRNDPARADQLLAGIDDDAPQALRVRALELRARSELAHGDAFASAHTRAQLDRDLQGGDRDHNRGELLAALGTLDAQALRANVDTLAADDALRPWLEQALRKQGQTLPRTLPQPSRQIGTIAAGEGGGLSPEGYRPPQRVALLLPQSAQFAGVAQSIRDGFMTAWAADRTERRPQLHVYDSGKTPQDAIAAYGKAVADGADRVVGPLLREAVGSLFHETLAVPVLALNHPDTGEVPPPGSAEYGLLPDSEGAQVAERMLQRGITRAAAIGADADWSQRAVKAFRAQFESGGGTVVGQSQLGDKDINYATSITQATASLGQGDDAGVFISVRPQQARLLVPQLRAARIVAAIFATSHIYAGDTNAALDRDLDGVEFCDAPWLFGPIAGRTDRNVVAAQVDSANGAGGRLFAFGMDAYALLPYIDWLTAHPDAYVNGATGQLTADHFGRVHRLVGWARFANGIATPVTGALEATPAPAQ